MSESQFKIEQQYSELFEHLDDGQRRAVVQSIAANWHAGWEPMREDIENLTDDARGAIHAAEYDRRADAAAHRAAEAARRAAGVIGRSCDVVSRSGSGRGLRRPTALVSHDEGPVRDARGPRLLQCAGYPSARTARAEVVRFRTTARVLAMKARTAQITRPAIPAPRPSAGVRADSIAA